MENTDLSKLNPTERYKRRYVKRKVVEVNQNTDSDIIKKLEKVNNFQGYVKELIRRDSETYTKFK